MLFACVIGSDHPHEAFFSRNPNTHVEHNAKVSSIQHLRTNTNFVLSVIGLNLDLQWQLLVLRPHLHTMYEYPAYKAAK